MLRRRMYGAFLSGCLRQRWSQGCLHYLARWILQSPTTVSAACFMSPAVLIFYTLFNSSPYNIHISNAPGDMSNCFWILSYAAVLLRCGVSGKHKEDIPGGSISFGGQAVRTQSLDLLKFVTLCTICHGTLYVTRFPRLRTAFWFAIYWKDMLH